jgi:hypothetical protein
LSNISCIMRHIFFSIHTNDACIDSKIWVLHLQRFYKCFTKHNVDECCLLVHFMSIWCCIWQNRSYMTMTPSYQEYVIHIDTHVFDHTSHITNQRACIHECIHQISTHSDNVSYHTLHIIHRKCMHID